MLDRKERKKKKIKAALELFHSSVIIIFNFVVFIFLLFIYLSFFVFLSFFFSCLDQPWHHLFFFFLPYQPSFGSGCSKILSVLFLPQCRLLFRLPAICTVTHISPGFFASLPLDLGPGSSLVLGWYTKHKKPAKGGFLGGWKPWTFCFHFGRNKSFHICLIRGLVHTWLFPFSSSDKAFHISEHFIRFFFSLGVDYF